MRLHLFNLCRWLNRPIPKKNSSSDKDSSSSLEDSRELNQLVSKLELDELLRILQLVGTEFVETRLELDEGVSFEETKKV